MGSGFCPVFQSLTNVGLAPADLALDRMRGLGMNDLKARQAAHDH
jgi:hypothetical protein